MNGKVVKELKTILDNHKMNDEGLKTILDQLKEPINQSAVLLSNIRDGLKGGSYVSSISTSSG